MTEMMDLDMSLDGYDIPEDWNTANQIQQIQAKSFTAQQKGKGRMSSDEEEQISAMQVESELEDSGSAFESDSSDCLDLDHHPSGCESSDDDLCSNFSRFQSGTLPPPRVGEILESVEVLESRCRAYAVDNGFLSKIRSTNLNSDGSRTIYVRCMSSMRLPACTWTIRAKRNLDDAAVTISFVDLTHSNRHYSSKPVTKTISLALDDSHPSSKEEEEKEKKRLWKKARINRVNSTIPRPIASTSSLSALPGTPPILPPSPPSTRSLPPSQNQVLNPIPNPSAPDTSTLLTLLTAIDSRLSNLAPLFYRAGVKDERSVKEMLNFSEAGLIRLTRDLMIPVEGMVVMTIMQSVWFKKGVMKIRAGTA